MRRRLAFAILVLVSLLLHLAQKLDIDAVATWVVWVLKEMTKDK